MMRTRAPEGTFPRKRFWNENYWRFASGPEAGGLYATQTNFEIRRQRKHGFGTPIIWMERPRLRTSIIGRTTSPKGLPARSRARVSGSAQ